MTARFNAACLRAQAAAIELDRALFDRQDTDRLAKARADAVTAFAELNAATREELERTS